MKAHNEPAPNHFVCCRTVCARDYIGAEWVRPHIGVCRTDRFQLSIIAKPSEATPLNVNIGLDRTVASLVPPIHDNTPQGRVDGEGVNMFAGFRANYDPGTQPLAGDLRIRTQFASGQAATMIAGDPDTVVRVVNVPTYRLARPPQNRSSTTFLRYVERSKI